ncbi:MULTISPECIES: trehalose operon repressor TreR [Photorhabdus]|uniref:Trehalose operon repressor n=1 Tax=Photorhabdus hindustanensis TaxID=2918802 RepID=A0A2S8PUX0_9GAMM|nr:MULTISPECIES: trehalose operon repressor TreR [Photorhabdus]MCC8458214.1 trehalose operon repressor TreR [Photorhabdus aegyptia]PQQ22645.1 trehalose operon repressor [Photorhabdus hindustanensis]
MSNKLTIKDIARLANVGKSTVSRVLNNENSVSPQVRERVEAIIQQNNFVPSKSARAMRVKSDKIIALIVSRLGSFSENLSISTMLPLFYQRGYDPIIMESNFDLQLLQEHLRQLALRHADGIILFGFTGLSEELLCPWRDKIVVLAREYTGFSSVCYDDIGAVRLLMNEFYRRGHRNISFLGVDDCDTTTGLLRHQSYLACCEQKDLRPLSAQCDLSYQSGFQHVNKVLREKTTALICATDSLALGAYKYLQQNNREDIQIGSIGNTPLLNFLYPNTLSIDLGYSEAGKYAAGQLIAQINRQYPKQQVIIPSKLA